MSRVVIGNLPPGTTIRQIDDFCSPFGRLLYIDVNNQGNVAMACVEFDSERNAYNFVLARHGYNFDGFTVQIKTMSRDSGTLEVREDSRRRDTPPPPPPFISSNSFDNNRGNNYLAKCNSGPGSLTDQNNVLDFNQACQVVYERFIKEGFDPLVAKRKTLEFVNSMQSGNNQGINKNSSDYFDQSLNTNLHYFGDNIKSTQTLDGKMYPGKEHLFPKSNWGSFNGPSNLQMSSNSGGGAREVGGMSYHEEPTSSRWNSEVNRYNSNPERVGNVIDANTVPRGEMPGPSVDHKSYLKSVAARKKIEAKVRKGISTSDDLTDLYFHTQIMDDYERNARYLKKQHRENDANDELPNPKDLTNLHLHTEIRDGYQRNARLQKKQPKGGDAKDESQLFKNYKSALGIVQKYRKSNLSRLDLCERNSVLKSRAMVEEYENRVSKCGGKIVAKYERRKRQLIEETEKKYPDDFRLCGAALKKLYLLTKAGFPASEARFLAVHPSMDIHELINLKKASEKLYNTKLM